MSRFISTDTMGLTFLDPPAPKPAPQETEDKAGKKWTVYGNLRADQGAKDRYGDQVLVGAYDTQDEAEAAWRKVHGKPYESGYILTPDGVTIRRAVAKGGGLMDATPRQVQIAEGMTTQRLNQERSSNEARLHAMSREEYESEAGQTAMRWRSAIDMVLMRRENEGRMKTILKRAKGQYVTGDDDNSIWVMTTGDTDRDGETVDPEGIDFTHFEQQGSPFLDNHNTEGSVTKVILGKVVRHWLDTVGEGTEWPQIQGPPRKAQMGEIQWNLATQAGREARDMAKNGMLNGGSISFTPAGPSSKNRDGGSHYSHAKLIEFTACPASSNPYAVRVKRFQPAPAKRWRSVGKVWHGSEYHSQKLPDGWHVIGPSGKVTSTPFTSEHDADEAAQNYQTGYDRARSRGKRLVLSKASPEQTAADLRRQLGDGAYAYAERMASQVGGDWKDVLRLLPIKSKAMLNQSVVNAVTRVVGSRPIGQSPATWNVKPGFNASGLEGELSLFGKFKVTYGEDSDIGPYIEVEQKSAKGWVSKAKLPPKFKVGDVVENEWAGSGMPTFVPGKVVEVQGGQTRRGRADTMGDRGTYVEEARYRVDFGNGKAGWLDESTLTKKSLVDKGPNTTLVDDPDRGHVSSDRFFRPGDKVVARKWLGFMPPGTYKTTVFAKSGDVLTLTSVQFPDQPVPGQMKARNAEGLEMTVDYNDVRRQSSRRSWQKAMNRTATMANIGFVMATGRANPETEHALFQLVGSGDDLDAFKRKLRSSSDDVLREALAIINRFQPGALPAGWETSAKAATR